MLLSIRPGGFAEGVVRNLGVRARFLCETLRLDRKRGQQQESTKCWGFSSPVLGTT